MKKILSLALGLLVAGAVGSHAADEPAAPKKKAPALTEEQTKLRNELIKKYDADGNGRLNAEEVAKFSAEDKKKADDAKLTFGGGGKKKKAE